MTDSDNGTGAGVLYFRTAEQIGVSYPQRTIELIVMPYEREAQVVYPDRPDRVCTEVISRGAFDGIERRANRVRVNRDHDLSRTVGRAVALHTSREDGLVAELRIAKTPLGDETLALAEDDCLDASAGFRPMPGGQVWETRDRCRMTKCWLGHIAMTPDPAYVDAKVLAVRDAAGAVAVPAVVGTPNLDRLELDGWRAQLAAIDSKYL